MDHWMPLLQVLAVPLLGLLARVTTVRGMGRLRAKIEGLQKLHESLPAPAKASLEPLIADLVTELVRLERRRLGRRVDAGSAFAVVFVAGVGGAAFAGGWALGTWWSIAIGGAVGLCAVLLLAVGITTLYKYPPETDSTAADIATDPGTSPTAVLDGPTPEAQSRVDLGPGAPEGAPAAAMLDRITSGEFGAPEYGITTPDTRPQPQETSTDA